MEKNNETCRHKTTEPEVLNGLLSHDSNKQNGGITTGDQQEGVVVESSSHPVRDEALVYKVSDKPPIHLTVLFAFQQALLGLANQLALSLMVAEAVCGEKSGWFKTKLLSSTLFMDGITTIAMVLFGVRLPLFQGAAFEYVVPLLALQTLDPERCEAMYYQESVSFNATLGKNITIRENVTVDTDDVIISNVQGLAGSLMVAGTVHFLIGATGLVGVILSFVGPVTIVPAILLIGLYMTRAAVKFIQVHWGIGLMTTAISLTLSLYLGRFKLPIPLWTRKRGCHVIRYPLHQVFALLIGIMVGWAVSGILTASGALTDDPNSIQYNARTDIGHDIITNASWFYLPHPGQFGTPGFNISALAGFFLATLISVLDSIGDYYACAKTCHVPPPPSHAMNRGIAVEGLCTFLSGTLGCGHATSTYGGNVGAIGITRVGSRQVFLLCGIIYIAFGVIGKFSAVFITIPYPVLGGALVIMFGMFIGVVLSNLQYVSLTSTRNLAIIGTSVMIGLMVPYWVEQNKDGIKTGLYVRSTAKVIYGREKLRKKEKPGNTDVDRVLKMVLGNANLAGAVLACFLDNTIPGTKEERGIIAWRSVVTGKQGESDKERLTEESTYDEGIEIYDPLLPSSWKKHWILRYIPFLPSPESNNDIRCKDHCRDDAYNDSYL